MPNASHGADASPGNAFRVVLCLVACLSAAISGLPATAPAQSKPASITVQLGDVLLAKLPFIVAADTGIYERNGLAVSQFITPSAAEAVKQSGVVVPPQYIKS